MSEALSKRSFEAGWRYGRKHGASITGRQIAERFPWANERAFAEGVVDGADNDTWRLNLTLGVQACSGSCFESSVNAKQS